MKFVTRRSKERVMAAKKKLHNLRGGRTGRPPPRPAAPRRTTTGEGDGSDDGDGDASDDGNGGQHVDGLNGDEDQALINMNWPDGVNIYISRLHAPILIWCSTEVLCQGWGCCLGALSWPGHCGSLGNRVPAVFYCRFLVLG